MKLLFATDGSEYSDGAAQKPDKSGRMAYFGGLSRLLITVQ
jgi:hypothetical protein